MSQRGREALFFALRASCGILAAILLVLVYAGDFSARTYELWRFAAELWRLPVGILLLTSLTVVVTEDLR